MLAIKYLFMAIILPFVFTPSGPAFAGGQSVTLAWDANTPAPTGYRMFMRDINGTYDYQTPVWDGTATTCTIPVPDGSEVAFVVRAYLTSQDGTQTAESADSNEVTYLSEPMAPVDFVILSSNGQTVTLQWSANTPVPTGYRVFQKTASGTFDYNNPVWDGTGTTCTLTVPIGEELDFVVKAYQTSADTGNTAMSPDSASVTYLSPPAAPADLLMQAVQQLTQVIQELQSVLQSIQG